MLQKCDASMDVGLLPNKSKDVSNSKFGDIDVNMIIALTRKKATSPIDLNNKLHYQPKHPMNSSIL